MRRLALPVSFLLLAQPGTPPPGAAYRNPRLPVEVRVQDLLRRMTREEKFWQLYMAPGELGDGRSDFSRGMFGVQVRTRDTADAAFAHATRINAVQRAMVEGTRLGIPMLPFEEGLHGLLAGGATVFPQAIGLAATWDTMLVAAVAGAIGREARSRGIRDLLSPVVNLATDARWGRVEETWGEDPWLTSRMGVAFVGPIERAGVVTTPKHLVANVGDGGRDSYPIHLDARTLDEVHFPPFQAAFSDGGARAVMTAYNSVGGVPATQNRWLLRDKLRREWGFSGVAISDASATGGSTVLHYTEPSTVAAAAHAWTAGLDVVFQGGPGEWGPYREAVVRGLVPEATLNAAVARVLRLKFQLGLFERPYANPDSARHWSGHEAHRSLALAAARKSLVLLRNRDGGLPLAATTRRIAVVGVDAAVARFGGYSGSPVRHTTILDGIRARAGASATVRFEPGPGRASDGVVTVPAAALSAGGLPGLEATYHAAAALDGAPALERRDSLVDFSWTLSSPGRGIPLDAYAARWTGEIHFPDGATRLGVESNDGVRLWVDEQLVLDRWGKASAGTHLGSSTFGPGRRRIRLEFRETVGNGRVRLVWTAGAPNDADLAIAAAAGAAARSDVAIVVAGIEEGEFRDRASLALPGRQEQLINAVSATGTPTVVVLVGGSAITMSRWIDKVAAVVHAWYPGQEGGTAVAEVLWGDVNPAGRLPLTFPLAEGQLPLTYNHRPTGRGDRYLDLPGEPLFPFGFGLSYSSFAYADLAIDAAPRGSVIVRCRVTNTGKLPGDEVVQLYLRDVLATTVRPVQQLAGFQRVHIAPGASTTVTFRIERAQLRILDTASRWVVEPGTFRVMVGASARDIRLHGSFRIP